MPTTATTISVAVTAPTATMPTTAATAPTATMPTTAATAPTATMPTIATTTPRPVTALTITMPTAAATASRATTSTTTPAVVTAPMATATMSTTATAPTATQPIVLNIRKRLRGPEPTTRTKGGSVGKMLCASRALPPFQRALRGAATRARTPYEATDDSLSSSRAHVSYTVSYTVCRDRVENKEL
ncbi:uncharacterized protein LOC143904629 isoform X2 [Temnothorax americanus]|uniref:uncharacterized protein LOC143904629 isoform X2 n=1 Tax=Temnothorax americanus TaxID=1964332 RepID=UPI004068C19A